MRQRRLMDFSDERMLLVERAGGCKVTSQSEGSLITAAQLLGCDKDELRKSLVSRAMQATKGGRAGTIIQYDSVDVHHF